jgi:hypothetical protein
MGIRRYNPAAKPELKSYEINYPYLPIRMGNAQQPDATDYYTVDSGAGTIWATYTGTNTGAFIFLLNAMPQGTDFNNRIGRTIQIKSVLVNIVWRLGQTITEGTFPTNIRAMLVWDKNPNGAWTSNMINTILLPVKHIGQNYSQPHSPNNLEYRDRYRTLWDSRESLTAGGDSSINMEKYVKVKGETVFTNVSGTTIGCVSSGAIYLILCSDLPVGTAQVTCPFATFSTRVRYTDA